MTLPVRTFHRAGAALALAALVATALGGCSSDDDGSAAAGNTEPSTVATTTTGSTTTTPSQRVDTPRRTGLRGVRYCEVLLLSNEGGRFRADVWNTLGMNDCPQAEWDALDASSIATERGALAAILNGPRFWTLDSITSDIRTDADETTFGTLGMFLAATIDLGTEPPSQDPYVERQIRRETVFGWDNGSEVYELVAPDGTAYVMQAYSQIKDPTLTASDLPTLGDRLDPPEGWTYRVRTLDDALDVLSTDGVATVVQDELQNTYQRVNGS